MAKKSRNRWQERKYEAEAARRRNREFLRAHKPKDPNALGRLRIKYIAECLTLRSGILTYCEYALPEDEREALRSMYFKGLSDVDLTATTLTLRRLWSEYGKEGMDVL